MTQYQSKQTNKWKIVQYSLTLVQWYLGYIRLPYNYRAKVFLLKYIASEKFKLRVWF